ncbi:hypothetical protein KSP40_PGU009651 [Platanthera guangdongensis]|uniref:Dol-P-Glc:Glc(2)Man(9)GlcNAc(2)-PP-Dol alpha-1,2-glucosyltransferase n=1 Tax=Platanthera guangdongensis TaxID=2320717 RepID=A0ABR2LXJ9_9ASPA
MGRVAVAAITSLWIIPISIAVNRIVPDPYMDEIFHIPQAQRYCHGDFKTWDPMITTPPGLYYISLVYVASLFPGMWFARVVQSFPELCSIPFLRSSNAVMAVVCSVLVYDLLVFLRPSLSEKKATIYAVLIALYPLHCFFTFLYYTDVASVTAVLAMYLTCLRRQFFISAMFGGFATLCRQTNVVWLAFVAATGSISYVEDLCRKDHVNLIAGLVAFSSNVGATIVLRRSRRAAAAAPAAAIIAATAVVVAAITVVAASVGSCSVDPCCLMNEICDLSLMFWHLKWNVLVTFFPFLLVLVAFVAFVFHNGGIVLGAKEAHVVSPHFAQLMYFGLAAAAALAPVHFSFGQASILWQLIRRNKAGNSVKILASLVICLIFVHFFSVAHPYLLADNRHYTFYIWRRVIQAHWSIKYFLVPLYAYSWFSIISTLAKAQRKVWVLLFCLATAAVLIPTPLIEFRYFTIPFYFLILNSRAEDNSIKWMLIGIIYSSINIFVMLMFLFCPFRWDHEPGIQRFIWLIPWEPAGTASLPGSRPGPTTGSQPFTFKPAGHAPQPLSVPVYQQRRVVDAGDRT